FRTVPRTCCEVRMNAYILQEKVPSHSDLNGLFPVTVKVLNSYDGFSFLSMILPVMMPEFV
ncbi:MAG: hypothetical protein LUH07_05415, partial [Lachnospiraceae bacterium]|nr:hypothetical protein [Lachnospiraceae bacterium]